MHVEAHLDKIGIKLPVAIVPPQGEPQPRPYQSMCTIGDEDHRRGT